MVTSPLRRAAPLHYGAAHVTQPSRRQWLQLAALGAAAPACRRWRRAGEVVLGEVGARTGERAGWGEDLHRGLELALDQQNLRGGINGRALRLLTVDDESLEARAASQATRLIEREGPILVFGELSTVANERAAAQAQRREVPFVAAASTARDVSRVGDWVFRTALTDGEQAQCLARHARQTLQKRRCAIVYRRNALLQVTMADAFASGFRAGGGDVALRDSYTDEAELVRLVARVRAANADVVYAPAEGADAGRIAVALKQGRVSAQVMGSDGWASPEVRQFAREALVGVMYSDAFSPQAPRPEVDTFVAAFRERYRAMPGTFAALGFDAARWVVAAALRVRQLDARALRDALLGSRVDEAVAGAFAVDARRNLSRSACILRYETQGVVLAAMMTP